MKAYGFAVSLLLLLARPGAAVDVTGSWQANLDCGYYANATSFLQIQQDPDTGALSSTLGPSCGTAEIADGPGIQPITTCVTTPAVGTGQVSGTSFALPDMGMITSNAVMAAPFFYPLLNCTVARIVVDTQYVGTVTAQAGDAATRVEGTLFNGYAEFRRPDDSLCYAIPNLLDCTFVMLRTEVPAGTNVTVAPNPRVSVTFETVASPGTAAVTALTSASAAVPLNFQLYAHQGLPIFYGVGTTATFAGQVTTCVAYPDANDDGVVDGTSPPLYETDLRVLHEEGASFVDRTLSLDTAGNVVCAATTGLSQLAYGAPAAPPPPAEDYVIPGTKLVLKRSASGAEKTVFRVLSPLLPYFGASNLQGDGLAIDLVSDTEGVSTLVAPGEGWEYGHFNPSGVVLRFVGDASSPVKRVVVRRGRVNLKAAAVGLPLATTHGAVAVRLRTGTLRACVRFEGAGVVRADEPGRFVASNAPSGTLADCSDGSLGIGSPSGAFLER